MNRLVEYMEKHHNPMGNVFRFVRVDQIITETGWTREEIFNLAREAAKARQLRLHYDPMDGRRHSHEMKLRDLYLISAINNVYRKMGIKG